ncbi:MAG: RecX family transcriptional regulator [Ignavibacteriales bacterium]|nr:RecX family transcriptional regulator [Ignavibacteriales bacterium]
MVVSRVLRQRGKTPKYAIFLDGKYTFDVGDMTLMKFGLTTGKTLQPEMVEKIKDADLFHQGQKVALNYISYRPRSSGEVMVRLNQKGFPLGVAQRVVQHFQSVSLINDLEFARMFVRDRLRAKLLGRALLKQQLLAKGMSRQIIDNVLSEYVSDESQQKAATDLANKRLKLAKRSFARLEPLKRKRRLFEFLLRRGFSSDVANKTVRRILD